MPVWSQFVEIIEWGLRGLADLSGSAGLSVIIFTLLFKIVVLPLSIKSVRSMYAMQVLQPKIKELQDQYNGDRQKLSAETIKLYQAHGVNPLAGCLPMLMQAPIFLGLYYAIKHLSESGHDLWGQSFLWLPSLAQHDPLYILPIAAGLLQLAQTLMSRPAGQGRMVSMQQQAMNGAMLFLPLMVVIVGLRFASGAVLYWVVSELFNVGQQWLTTGWGLLAQWLPFLPDIPEHKRLGYVRPEARAALLGGSQSRFIAAFDRQIKKQVDKVDRARTAQEPPKTLD